MKEFKGTKGLWETFNDDDELKVIQSGSMEHGSGWRSYSPICGEVSNEDDANLIAAAPDLLHCLQQIVSSAYRLGLVSDDDSGLSLEVSKAEFYIAKALGETK